MSWAPFLLLAVVGGYAFSTMWKGALYFSARESGHRLYFRAVFYAAFLLLVAALLHVILFVNVPSYPLLVGFVGELRGVPDEPSHMWSESSLAVIVAGSFATGPLLAGALNFPHWPYVSSLKVPYFGFEPAYAWNKLILDQAIKNNDFEKLVARSVYRKMPMLLTLKTGKVYVGWAVRAPNPVAERKAIRILPLLSGYRDEPSQKPVFVTDYYEILRRIDSAAEVYKALEHMHLGDFEVVIPTEQIVSAHLFDIMTYQYFLENDGGPKVDEIS